MAWEHELAKHLKKENKRIKEKATADATVFIGTVENKNPLIISIEDGQLMYEEAEGEIIITKTFDSRRNTASFAVGDTVICLPTDGLASIVALDIGV